MKLYKIKNIRANNRQNFIGNGTLVVDEAEPKSWMAIINEDFSSYIGALKDYFDSGENFLISFTVNDREKGGEVYITNFNINRHGVYVRMKGIGDICGFEKEVAE